MYKLINTRKALILAFLAVLEAGLLLLANFLAIKIWHIGPIIQDGGVIVFPIIYVVGDLIVELYDEMVANLVAAMAALLSVIAMVTCFLVTLLPDLPNANAVSLVTAFGLSARVMRASALAFICSAIVNNALFRAIKERTSLEAFWKRSLGSSLLAHVIDAGTFNTLAFAGRVSPMELLGQILSAIVVGMTLETLLNLLTKKIAWWLRGD